jgi:hypothetical protein
MVMRMMVRWVREGYVLSGGDTSKIHRLEGRLPDDYVSCQRDEMIRARRMLAGFLDRDFDPPSLSWVDDHARVV